MKPRRIRSGAASLAMDSQMVYCRLLNPRGRAFSLDNGSR